MTSSITARWFWTVLLAIAGLSLIWRIVFVLVWRDGIFIYGDAYFYHESGRQLAEGVGWVNPLEYNNDGTQSPAADHPPLYILFLGFWSWVGLAGPTAHMILTAIFISTPMVIMTALAAREFGGRRLGLIAGGLAAIYPNIWSWDGTILSEILAMLFLSTTVYVVYRFWNRPSFGGAALMGVSLSLATFSRAELLLLSVLVVTPMVLLVKQWDWRTRLSALVIAGVASAAVLAPWVAFNLSRFEKPVYLSEGYQITLATSTCDATYYGDFTGYWSMTCPEQFLAEAGLTRENSDQSERSAVLLEKSIDYIQENITRLPTVVVVRWLRIVGLWKPVKQSDVDAYLEGRDLWVTRVAQTTSYVFMALAAAGVVIMRRRRIPVLPLVGPLIAIFITITITFAQNRYRASVEPAIAILAAVAVEQMVRGWLALRDDPEDSETSVDRGASALT